MENKREYIRHAVVLTLAVASLTIFAAPSLTSSGLASAQVTAPSWSFTGSLNTARAGHTATLLTNGKVLVAGGFSDEHRAELYDPATGTWSNTGSLNTIRTGHTATLLQNGKVLVAGGHTVNGGFLDTAELYDPATGAWSFTGRLNKNRVAHTATLLQNGKVLVAGGYNSDDYVTTSAELYDPNTGEWSLTGTLVANDLFGPGRGGHTATLLQSGKVLVAGGLDPGDFGIFSTELYDPTTGTWTVSGRMNDERGGHTATLLPNGHVLIVGACNSGVFCGRGNSGSSAELYNPATGTWSVTGALTPRFFHTATLLPNGRVLIAGGEHINFFSGTTVFLNSAEIYDPASGNWSTTANLNGPRLFHAATLLLNGKVLVVGGVDRIEPSTITPLQSAELYDSGIVFNPNPIDDPQFFVAQHYRDFLSREPDPPGLAFWTNEITSCGGDPQCIEVKRINVSAAFFLSIEFQNTGYLVERMYKAAYGDATDTTTGLAVPIIRRAELSADSALLGQGVIVNTQGWEQQLQTNKRAFALAFVQRQRFVDAYPIDLTAVQFVTRLNQNSGNVLTEEEMNALISALTMDGTAATRADVLRKVAENSLLDQRERNRAFVLMQYFGYLRRDPNSAPDSNYAGYHFWLDKLDRFGGDFIQAEMVKAFITSIEYRQRFGQ
jgi:Galactose oxidase, central domain